MSNLEDRAGSLEDRINSQLLELNARLDKQGETINELSGLMVDVCHARLDDVKTEEMKVSKSDRIHIWGVIVILAFMLISVYMMMG